MVVRRLPSGNADHHHEQKTAQVPGGRIFGHGENRPAFGFDHFGVVRRQAPRSFEGGNRVDQLRHAGSVPVLRVPAPFQRRISKDDGDPRLQMPGVRKEVRAIDRHRVRFEEDSHIRVGRVPRPPIRVPFRRHVGRGQQKRRFHRALLAQQGLSRPRGLPRRRLLFRRRLDRRGLRPRLEVREGEGRGGRIFAASRGTNAAS